MGVRVIPSVKRNFSTILAPLRGVGLRALASAVAKLSGAAVTGQLIALAASPILLRFYSPKAFGIYLAMTIVTSLGSAVATGRFELAIQSPRSLRKAVALAMAAGFVAIFASALIWCFFYLAADAFAWSFRLDDVRVYSYFVPTMLLATATIEILRFLHWRRKAFNVTAIAMLIAAVTNVLAQIGLGFADAGPHGLLIGACVGQLTAAGYLLAMLSRYQLPQASLFSLRNIVSVAVEYRAFPLVTMPAGLVHMVAMQAPAVTIGSMFGPDVGGLYYLASRLISAPVAVLSSAIYPTFVSLAVDLHRGERSKLLRLYLLAVTGMIVITSPLLLLYPIGGDLFAIAFGERWREAGTFAAWISLGAILQLAAMSTSSLNALRQNHLHALWVALNFGVIGTAAIAAQLMHLRPELAVACFAISSAISHACLIVLNVTTLRRHSNDGVVVGGAQAPHVA
jgi:O-antigen/teichoic acid export membrane protein